jgi:membrane protein DedA with SNARE-associated domain
MSGLMLLLQAAAPAARQLHHLSLLERLWKYVALGGLSIVFEEANPIWGGIHAKHGRLDLAAVIVAVAVGTWAASLALYGVGYWRIDWVRRRFPKKERLLDAALQIVQRNPWRASLAIRFAYWLRLPLPIACGAARVPLSLFVLASGISCWLWSIAFVALGYWASAPALAALRYTRRNDVQLAIAAVILVALLWFMVTRRRRFAERTAHVLTGEDIPIMTTAERATPMNPLRRISKDSA